MNSVDMFCVGDDRHRVALLEDFLVQAGQSVTLYTRPRAEPSDPCLVACTARSLRAPWIAALFDSDVAVVALRLDDTPLPGPCLRAIDLQSWPARTADRKVGDLVDWLMRQGGPGAVGDAQAGADGRAGGGARRVASGRTSDNRRALLVLLLLIGGGALLLNLAPERRPGRDGPGPDEMEIPMEAPVVAGTSMAPDVEDDPVPATVEQGAEGVEPAAGSIAEPAGSLTSPTPAGPADGDAVQRDGVPADDAADTVGEGAMPAVSQVGETAVDEVDAGTTGRIVADGAPEASGVDGGSIVPAATADTVSTAPQPARGIESDDALAHLCAARSLAAARAWSGALNWKQRRRALSEPCVERLLARPGYAPLGSRLMLR
jgi:hypothetical protein